MSRCRCASVRRGCSNESMTDPWSPLCEQCEAEGCDTLPDSRRVRLTANGMQVVTIKHRYAYAWPGEDRLEVGDWVVLPAGYEGAIDWVGEVTAQGGEWDGDLVRIIDRWREPKPPLYD